MQTILQRVGGAAARRWLAIALLWLAAVPAAQAHLMVAQRGTLNIVDDGAFMVLSLPVSAFRGVDDDGDGRLSMAEFGKHRQAIASAVTREVQLSDPQGARPLAGLMLTLSPPDQDPTGPAAQLIAMGRFALAAPEQPLRMQVGLFGSTPAEQTLQLTVTHRSEAGLLVLTPERPHRALFASGWSVFADYVVLGAEHIFTGFDHLLFLLVVLAGGWGWRHVLAALTTFTVGHAITLMLSLQAGLAVSPALVEPAIAATIVGMAAFDFYARRRDRLPSPWLRLSLVFGASLIHGLGLAVSLASLGLDSGHRLQSLAGFNVGTELGQVAVALVAALVVLGLKRLRGDAVLSMANRVASVLAIGIGSAWFAGRVLGMA